MSGLQTTNDSNIFHEYHYSSKYICVIREKHSYYLCLINKKTDPNGIRFKILSSASMLKN